VSLKLAMQETKNAAALISQNHNICSSVF